MTGRAASPSPRPPPAMKRDVPLQIVFAVGLGMVFFFKEQKGFIFQTYFSSNFVSEKLHEIFLNFNLFLNSSYYFIYCSICI